MRLAVIGAGAWGTALAKLLAESGNEVTLWCREPEVRDAIQSRRVNERFLADIELPATLAPVLELSAAAEAELVLLAVPSAFLRRVLEKLAASVRPGQRFVSATKGLEGQSHLRMSEVVEDVLPFTGGEVVAISGPTFAREVALGSPTALVAASRSEPHARFVQELFSTPSFRLYTNDDIIGVELGGALKNVIALAAGVATGMGLGHNPLAAIMTRGLAEISRLAEALGGRRETLAGLSGMGDLVLTCTGHLSRNRHVGELLGQGKSIEAITASMDQVAEGVRTTHAAIELAAEKGIEMPIANEVDRLLRGETTPSEVVEALMTRPLKAENQPTADR